MDRTTAQPQVNLRVLSRNSSLYQKDIQLFDLQRRHFLLALLGWPTHQPRNKKLHLFYIKTDKRAPLNKKLAPFQWLDPVLILPCIKLKEDRPGRTRKIWENSVVDFIFNVLQKNTFWEKVAKGEEKVSSNLVANIHKESRECWKNGMSQSDFLP
jgi:hypothetical protein